MALHNVDHAACGAPAARGKDSTLRKRVRPAAAKWRLPRSDKTTKICCGKTLTILMNTFYENVLYCVNRDDR